MGDPGSFSLGTDHPLCGTGCAVPLVARPGYAGRFNGLLPKPWCPALEGLGAFSWEGRPRPCQLGERDFEMGGPSSFLFLHVAIFCWNLSTAGLDLKKIQLSVLTRFKGLYPTGAAIIAGNGPYNKAPRPRLVWCGLLQQAVYGFGGHCLAVLASFPVGTKGNQEDGGRKPV